MIALDKVSDAELEQLTKENDDPNYSIKRDILRMGHFSFVDDAYLDALETRELKRLHNRAKKIETCGYAHHWFNPATGIMEVHNWRCNDQLCNKCTWDKAEMEMKVFQMALRVGDLFRTVIPDNKEYNRVRDKIRRTEGWILYRRYPRKDLGNVIYTNVAVNEDSKPVETLLPSEFLEAFKQLKGKISGSIPAPIVGINRPLSLTRQEPKEQPESEKPVPPEPEPKVTVDFGGTLAEYPASFLERNGFTAAKLAEMIEQDPVAAKNAVEFDYGFDLVTGLLNTPEDKKQVFYKKYALILHVENDAKKLSDEIMLEALSCAYKDTYDLDPELETLQESLNERQDAFFGHIKRLCELRNFQYNITHISNSIIITRKKVAWKSNFKQYVLSQFDFEDDLAAFFE